jgi:methyl halide transferase
MPNSTYWSNLYRNNDSPWDIPGAGNAYEAEYLIDSEFRHVYVCDYAEEPLKNFYARCPRIKKGNLLHKDFFKLKGVTFDLIIEQTFFCALEKSQRPIYFQKMLELLKPGGRVAGVLFNHEFDKQGPPFGGTKEEYLGYIGDEFKIKVFDDCHNSIKPREGRELFFILEKSGS